MRIRNPRIEGNGGPGGWSGTHVPQVAELTPYGIIHGAEASTMRTVTPWHLISSVEFDKALLLDQPATVENVQALSAAAPSPVPSIEPKLEQNPYRPQLPEQFIEGRYRNLMPGDVLALPVTKDGEPTGDIRVRGIVVESSEVMGEEARQVVVKVRRDEDTVVSYEADPSQQCYVENPEWRRWQAEGEARLPDGSRIRRED